MKIAKARTIYDNYDLWEKYPDEDLKEMAVECEWIDEEEKDDITDNQLWDWRYHEDEVDWDCAKTEIDSYFKGKTVGFFGDVGLWHGVYKAGKIGEFWKLFNDAIEDCDYIRIYDENGHLYLTCSHHDGTNHFEIKEVTDKGTDYLERWEYSWGDKRSECDVHTQIYKRFSKLPRFAEKVFGCKAREFEESTKGKLIDKINNMASSNYC